jgi:hypothetical protein
VDGVVDLRHFGGERTEPPQSLSALFLRARGISGGC